MGTVLVSPDSFVSRQGFADSRSHWDQFNFSEKIPSTHHTCYVFLLCMYDLLALDDIHL
jgi:hypothetical protein